MRNGKSLSKSLWVLLFCTILCLLSCETIPESIKKLSLMPVESEDTYIHINRGKHELIHIDEDPVLIQISITESSKSNKYFDFLIGIMNKTDSMIYMSPKNIILEYSDDGQNWSILNILSPDEYMDKEYGGSMWDYGEGAIL